MAIYQNNALLEYPTYGLDMIGKIKDDELQFYLKDHLGSIRATIYDNKLMSAQDYDAWGYILEGRTYESEEGKFKYTAKERPVESFYDYFGARYYDSRIRRWGSPDVLESKALGWTPYRAFFDNPLMYIDPNGRFEFPQAKEYGKLASYLENDIQKVSKNTKIMNALEKYSGLSRAEISKAFEWGKGPTIKVTELEGAFGQFTMNIKSEELRISSDLVNLLQNSESELSDVYIFMIGVTILHELTHYGVDKTGYGYSNAITGKAAEHGEYFEKAAYGQVIGNIESAIDYLNLYNERKKLARRYYKEYYIDQIDISP